MTEHDDDMTPDRPAAGRPNGGGVAVDDHAPPGAAAADGAKGVSPVAPETAGALGSGRIARALGSRSGWLLGVCCVAQFMVILDLSIVNVALPSIQSSLGFSSPELQWVVDAYAITFAGFLMLGGRAADYFGQRRTFVVALLLFSLASLIGGVAPDRAILIGARAGQGFAGALMAACSLAIITSSFPPGPQLHRAVGLWATMNGAGGAAGVLFGGIITQTLTWRWVLLINPPIGIAAALVAYYVVTDRRRAREARFDLAGAFTLTAGQIILVYGVVKAGLVSWHALAALLPIIIGLGVLVMFTVIEARVAAAPLVPFKELTKPTQVANTIVVLFSAALFPMWFVSSLYLQQVLGLSPLDTGLIFLPMALTIMLCASRAGKLVGRFGVRPVLASGLIMMTTGLLLFTRIASSGSAVVYIMVPGLLTAAGIALSIVPSTIAATQGAKEGQAGLASGLVNTSRQVGGGLGLAVLITLATQHSTHLIGTGKAVPEALTQGFRLAYYIAAGLAAAAVVLTFTQVAKPAAALGPAVRRAPIAIGVAVVIAGFIGIEIATAGSHGAPIGTYTTQGAASYASAPGLRPPIIRADAPTKASKLAPGYLFLANFYDLTEPPMVGQSGPLILDRGLQPVWFRPVDKSVIAANLSLQTYQGKPALGWWQGVVTSTGETLSGQDVVVNQHYQPVATLKGAGGWIITLHSLVIRGDDAWVTANKNVPMNLSKYGGTYNGALIDSAVQEYNLKTGQLLRTWDALKHIPLIDWTLGGRHSSFKFGPGAAFQWQHDVEMHPGSIVTMYDDHCCQITGGGTFVPPTAPSRGLILRLDQGTRTARLVAEYPHPDQFNAAYLGSAEPLPNGNMLVGWGAAWPSFSEYSRSGQQLLDATFPRPDQSYRAKLEQWTGLPLDPPAGAARNPGGHTTVYASWNGATRVVSWRVLGGPSAGSLARVTTKPKSGFETAIPVPGSFAAFRVQALDANGRVIGTSQPFTVAQGPPSKS